MILFLCYVLTDFIILSKNVYSLLGFFSFILYYNVILLLCFYLKIKENRHPLHESFSTIRTFMEQLRIFFLFNRNFTFKTMYVFNLGTYA